MSLIEDLLDTLGASRRPLLLAALEQLAEGVIVADADGKLVFINSAAAAIHGVKRLDVAPEEYSEAYQLLTPDGAPHPFEELPLARAVQHGETVKDAHWKIKRPDGVIVDAIGAARPVFDEDGDQVASVLTISDRTKELSARRSLSDALAAKETLLYELNHRVKNSLAIVSSMVRLQGRAIGDAEAKRAFADIASRVAVLADLHGRLYQTGAHNRIEVVSFLNEILTDTVLSLGTGAAVDIVVRQNGRAEFSIEKAVTLALALNELVLNSIKHAFEDTKDPVIEVQIDAEAGALSIIYRDNGCGLPAEPAGPPGIGRALVASLSTQLNATVEQRAGGPGFQTTFRVPLAAASGGEE
ncbi:sensor histidine kinase [Hyphococcus sp.]|uniref:sensor histidine kinase n=1 Tax=Hyphococcus sp. TaxID=2038636 RepID=UPI003CCBD428